MARGSHRISAAWTDSVNNAGIVRDGLLVKVKDGAVVGSMSLDQWNAVIGVNLTGVFLCGREAAKHMIERGNGGVIVNISSISRARQRGPDQLQRRQGWGRIHGGGLGEGTRPLRHPCGLGGSGLHAYRDSHLDAAGSAREDDRAGTAEAARAARGNRAGRCCSFSERLLHRPLSRDRRRPAAHNVAWRPIQAICSRDPSRALGRSCGWSAITRATEEDSKPSVGSTLLAAAPGRRPDRASPRRAITSASTASASYS